MFSLLQDIPSHQEYRLANEVHHEPCYGDLSLHLLHIMVMTTLQYQTLRETHSIVEKVFRKTMEWLYPKLLGSN